MRLSDFDYELPDTAIALRPVSPRSAARLLQVPAAASTSFEDRRVADLPGVLRAGDVLVVNNTKVIPARLTGGRAREGGEVVRIEATLIERLAPDRWRALVRPGKRLRVDDHVVFTGADDDTTLAARVAEKDAEGGGVVFAFAASGPDLDAAVGLIGAPPLPPYIAARRAADARDRDDYQTIFAATPGAVAAPTAALHFDAPLLEALDAVGVDRVDVTLHVGAGTFLPVKTDDVSEHRMHAEWGELSEEAAARLTEARARGARIVAVGTTSLRILETVGRSLERDARIEAWRGATDLFITPGFEFRVANGLLTNFHLPRSTLLMLVAAFVGRERILAAYAHAVEQGYRFYSYGDATLLWRDA